jgi:hypothetical protein
MTSIFPKIPGYTVYHDPTKVDFKKISSQMLQKINNGEVKPNKSNLPLPRQFEKQVVNTRSEKSKSYSQQTFVNHFGSENGELFQPDWVKLDKQVKLKLYFLRFLDFMVI